MKKIIIILLLAVFAGAAHDSVITKDSMFRILHPDEVKEVSQPVIYKNGILFTYSGMEDDEVYVSGSFPTLQWSKKIRMFKNAYGIFFIFIPLELKRGEYIYRYNVNDIWLNDPQQQHYANDGYGTRITAMLLENDLQIFEKSPKQVAESTYTFFLEDRGYSNVSWIGTANTWDPYVDMMQLDGNYWTITKKIKPGFTFYKFYIDGQISLDPANPDITEMKFGESVNYIKLD